MFINYLELYRFAYITESFGIVDKVGGLQTILSFIDLPTTESLWYRLQRMGYINYLELHRYAYITKGFYIVVKERGLSAI